MAALAATRLSLLAPSVPAMSSRASDKNRAKRPRGASAAPRASAEADGEAPYVPGGRIQNACIVITGANRGIGFEFTKQLLAQSPGNRVVAACRDAEGAENLMNLQLEVGPERLAVTTLDVSDEASIRYWASCLDSTPPLIASGGAVDVVINNAGTTGTDAYSKWELEDMDAEEMLHVFRINTVGPLLVVQQLLKRKLMGTQGVASAARWWATSPARWAAWTTTAAARGTPTARPSRRSTLSTNP